MIDDKQKGIGVDEELKLEVVRVVLMEDGDVILSPKPSGAVKALLFGLPMTGFGIYATFGGLEFAFMGLFALALGGLLTYIGFAGLSGPEIHFDIAGRQVQVKKRGEEFAEKWPVKAICRVREQPFSIRGLRSSEMGVVRARLALEPERSIMLFMTGNRRSAIRIAQWINNALEISSAGG